MLLLLGRSPLQIKGFLQFRLRSMGRFRAARRSRPALAESTAFTTSALAGTPNDSPAVPGTAIFGDWSSLLIGYWSGVDILINPYETTAYAKGRVLVRAMRDVDVQVRHPESFAFADDITV
jgi:hypothetical protein